MSVLNRKVALMMFIKHETLTLSDASKEENLGLTANGKHLGFLLRELEEGGFLQQLDGAKERTYTITSKGIDEGKRLVEEERIYS